MTELVVKQRGAGYVWYLGTVWTTWWIN